MINLYKPGLTNLQHQILRLLFINSGDFLNQRQIAKRLRVSPPAVMKALPPLQKINFINLKQDKETKRWAVEINRDNNFVMELKRVDNLKQIYESRLAGFLEKTFPGATIILFGSYSRGDDTRSSDIDLAVVGRKERMIELKEFEDLLERQININFYYSFKDIGQELKESLCNGIVLLGGIEL